MKVMEKCQQMTDIVHGSIPYSGIEHAVISTPIYNRLHRVLQSSLVYLTYPSNKVKRFEHSVGTMHLAGQMFFNSICNATEGDFESFISSVSDEVKEWRNQIKFQNYGFGDRELSTQYEGNKILSAPIPNCQFYNKYYPRFLKEKDAFTYFVTFQAVRLSGLLHDVGHLPYSHILEYALKKMYKSIKEKEELTDVEIQFLNIMNRFVEQKDEIHEEIGKLLVDNIQSTIIENITEKSNVNAFFFLVTFDFTKKILCSKPTDNTIFSDLHFIISSVLDADRLDYCTRDAYCAGTNKGVFNYERLLSTYRLTTISDEIDDTMRFYFCPSAKAVSSVEELLQRRCKIFSDINYHHRVHKHEVLLEETISELGIKELEDMEKVGELPYTMPLCVSSIWQLISKLSSGNGWPEYQIIQLDDSWLDTLLKHKFFEEYKENYLTLSRHGNDVGWNRFDELISANKRYHSLIKRSIDFREFDKQFFGRLIENMKDLKDYFKEKIPKISTYNEFYNTHQSFVFNYIIEKIVFIDKQRERIFDSLEGKLNERISDNKVNIQDCLVRSCQFSFGYQTATYPLYLLDEKGNAIKIEQLSTQLSRFQNERAVSPLFHVYYLPTYNVKYGEYNEVDREQFIKLLAECAFEVVFDKV